MEEERQLTGEEDVTFMMEELVEKLQILNYEKDFALAKLIIFLYILRGLQPLSRGYFAHPTNPNDQFNYFKMYFCFLI